MKYIFTTNIIQKDPSLLKRQLVRLTLNPVLLLALSFIKSVSLSLSLFLSFTLLLFPAASSCS
jgi:hypothetical protein